MRHLRKFAARTRQSKAGQGTANNEKWKARAPAESKNGSRKNLIKADDAAGIYGEKVEKRPKLISF